MGFEFFQSFQDEGTYFIASTADTDLLIDSNHRRFFWLRKSLRGSRTSHGRSPVFFYIYSDIYTTKLLQLDATTEESFYDGYAAGFTLFFTHRVTDQHCHLLFNKPSSVFFEMLIGVFLAHDIRNCYKSNHKSSLCVFFFFSSLPCDVVQQGTSIILWVILQVHYVLSRMSNVKCHLMYIVIYPEYVTRTMAIVNCCILLS